MGSSVANLPAGTTFLGLDNFNSPDIAFNGRDQVAMIAQLNTPGRAAYNALIATDLDGLLVCIAAEGVAFEVSPGDVRVVQSIGVYGTNNSPIEILNGEDGFGTYFNDAGLLTYRLGFTNGSFGNFVTLVPAPGSWMIPVLGCFVLGRRRR